MKNYRLTGTLISFFFILFCQGQNRISQDLSLKTWKLWLDKDAEWINDELFLPPVDITLLPSNSPTCGWNQLENQGIEVTLPTTVEEHFWGENGATFGVTGNYVGVSWFTSKVFIPEQYKGKRITLNFESVRQRAEIYINRQLTGYDVIGNTPFEVDISAHVKYNKENLIAIRITDPNGNFTWRDYEHFNWGKYQIMPSHGFGGITGKLIMEVTDPVYIRDVFVKNTLNAKEIEVEVELSNKIAGELEFVLSDNQSGEIIVSQKQTASLNQPLLKKSITCKKAKLWSPDHPHLYTITTKWKGADGSQDEFKRRFGFRSFEVKNVNGDRQFCLNGERIFLLSSISWSFWPVNGIRASDSWAKRQIETAKALGLNMLNFHRAIGQPNVFDYADELGLLYYQEPGGYHNNFPNQSPEQIDFYNKWRREKMFRMMKRDRSRPSLVIYNFQNERSIPPSKQDSADLLDAQRIDPTRIITYDSPHRFPAFGYNPKTPQPHKLHVLPYQAGLQDYGWWDEHHAGGPGCYYNGIYKSSSDYYKFSDNKPEIVFWGEEGAIGTPPQLGLIIDENESIGNKGWEATDYKKWYNAYEDFLQNNPEFRTSYKSVNDLCKSIGDVAYYYQGRVIENCRINNVTDGYVINGWEAMKLENHSGIVDNYRNPKGNVELISRYNRPLYIAVKIANKIVPRNNEVSADFFIVNQIGIKGKYDLLINATNKDKVIFSQTIPVKISGGNIFGELLIEKIKISGLPSGYTSVSAVLLKDKKEIAKGDDLVFAVEMPILKTETPICVLDTSGIISNFLAANDITTVDLKNNKPTGSVAIVGEALPPYNKPLVTPILEWINNGNTLIVIGSSHEWCEYLASKEIIDYRSCKTLGKVWYGGNFFSKPHPLFDGLPQGKVFNWEYQCFSTYDKKRIGMRIFSGETVVAAVSDHQKEIYSALSIIPLGRGKIILSSLDILSSLTKYHTGIEGQDKTLEGENAALNNLSKAENDYPKLIAQRLFLNMVKAGISLDNFSITRH